MHAASTGAITSRACPVAIFHSVAARDSWISGCGDRFSNGSTSCAGSRTTDSAASAPVSSHAASTAACSASAALLSATSTRHGAPAARAK